MIYITCDTHGDFRRVHEFCRRFETTEDDILIILGDAGINYYSEKKDRKLKAMLYSLPITLFCIHGNHEMRPQIIEAYKEVQWHGGTVYRENEYPNILFAKDGEVYDFDGISAIVIGGAYSVDKEYRLENGWSWWADEQPSDEIKARVEKALADRDNKINVTLNMSGGERLSVTFSDVLLGGMKVNRKTDYVSSMMLTSEAEIECTVPDSLINLSALSDERVNDVLNAIYNADEKADLSDVKDQLGSVVGKQQLKAAHDDMLKCINAADDDSRKDYADVIPGVYMYRTVYRAESVSALQSYIEEKRMQKRTKESA
jgi:3-oxoacid CoA-transferase subunit A